MMARQNQNQTVAQNQAEEKNNNKERVKAAFSLLNHFVKVYNLGETYIKRWITLFGLGTVIAGISFGAGQQISQKEVDVTNGSNNTSTSEVQSTPQPVNHNVAPTAPPSIIYLVPAPNQHNFIPTHTPVSPVRSDTSNNFQVQPAPAATPTPTPPTITNNTPVQPAPAATPTPIPSTTTTSPKVQPVVTTPPIPQQSESISNVITEVEQAVEPLKQASGILSDLKHTVKPWAEESDED